MEPGTHPRRQFLAGLAVGIVGLAGCTEQETTAEDTSVNDGTSADGEKTTPAAEATDTETDTTETDTPASTTVATTTLDRREANVVGVEFEPVDGGIKFGVSLNHDDNGEDGYADWWQVERLDGTQLGRRELLHAHANQPFTRWETIEIPAVVTCVVVRGHDQTHGYGGVAMLVSLDSGELRSIDQGSEPQSFETSDCP